MLFDEITQSNEDQGPAIRKVVACHLLDPKKASQAMKFLSNEFPMDRFQLSHLKRIRRYDGSLQTLLCPEIDWTAHPEESRVAWSSKYQFSKTEVVMVPAYPATNKTEFEASKGDTWPQNFHPATITDANVVPDEYRQHAMLRHLWAALADELGGREGGFSFGGAVLVDPRTGLPLVCASQVREELRRQGQYSSSHPLHTSAMLCIHGLAWKHQFDNRRKGGNKRQGQTKRLRSADGGGEGAPASPPPPSPHQEPWCLPPTPASVAKLPEIPWGVLLEMEGSDVAKDEINEARARLEEAAVHHAQGAEAEEEDEAVAAVVPYLCTGLDLYITHEPSAM